MGRVGTYEILNFYRSIGGGNVYGSDVHPCHMCDAEMRDGDWEVRYHIKLDGKAPSELPMQLGLCAKCTHAIAASR